MKKDQQLQARNLFFETDLTQAQIADLVGITQKTMSLWAGEGQWRRLKTLAAQTPMITIENMYHELARINEAILSREPEKQFATLEEAEIRRKTLASIKYVREYQLPASHAEVMMNFIDFMRNEDLDDTRLVMKYADQYLQGEVKLGSKDTFKSYYLPVTPEEQEKNNKTDNTPTLDPEDPHMRRWNDIVKRFKDLSVSKQKIGIEAA